MPAAALLSSDAALAWAAQQLSRRVHPSASIAQVQALPARVATLRRLQVESAGRTSVFYLKQHAAAAREGAPWTEHCGHLASLAQALRAIPGLLPYPLVACDAGLRATLTAEVQGDTAQQLYRRSLASPWSQVRMVEAWGGVGRWLATLHTLHQEPLTPARVEALRQYVQVRLNAWQAEDPGQADLATAALRLVTRLAATLARDGGLATLCHGDVSVGNILMRDGAVGLIDMDDLRVDLPGMDVSQALQELDEFTRFSSTVAMPGYRARAEAAFRDGYGGALPGGAAFWLPHLRNLAVAAVTLAPRRHTRPGWWTNRRYRRVLREIRRTVSAAAPES